MTLHLYRFKQVTFIKTSVEAAFGDVLLLLTCSRHDYCYQVPPSRSYRTYPGTSRQTLSIDFTVIWNESGYHISCAHELSNGSAALF